MAYTVKNSNGVVIATVADNTINATATSLTLIGKNYIGYGQKLNENLVYLLENFSKNSAPAIPTKGQLWYDTTTNDLKIYNGTAFVDAIKRAADLSVTGNLTVTGNANVTLNTNITGNANVTGNVSAAGFYFSNGTPLSTTQIVNGNSNVTVSANSNVTVGVAGNATVMTITGTGANINGTANISGNANVGNLGTTTAVITTGNITTINSGLLQNGTSNVTITNNANVTVGVAGNAAILTVTGTGANISGTANVTGNANVGNLGTATAVITTGNITTINSTTINSGLLQNGNSNVTIAANGNVTISAIGAANVVTVTATGANVSGTANISGNLTAGNISTTGANGTVQANNHTVTGAATGNANVSTVSGNLGLRSIASTYTDNNPAGTIANAAVHAIGTPTLAAANAVTFTNAASFYISAAPTQGTNATITNSYALMIGSGASQFGGNVLPSANATYNLGSTGSRWNNVWGVSSSALYADLAEKYHSDAHYSPGTVVKLGGSAEITICDENNSSDVFGIISENPAYLMNDNLNENYLPVVLHGRAKIKVIGPCKKGDRLVSSDTAGCAKVGTTEVTYQTEIGRALVDKNDSQVGIIEAFVCTK